jgi:hypothetical protein
MILKELYNKIFNFKPWFRKTDNIALEFHIAISLKECEFSHNNRNNEIGVLIHNHFLIHMVKEQTRTRI